MQHLIMAAHMMKQAKLLKLLNVTKVRPGMISLLDINNFLNDARIGKFLNLRKIKKFNN